VSECVCVCVCVESILLEALSPLYCLDFVNFWSVIGEVEVQENGVPPVSVRYVAPNAPIHISTDLCALDYFQNRMDYIYRRSDKLCQCTLPFSIKQPNERNASHTRFIHRTRITKGSGQSLVIYVSNVVEVMEAASGGEHSS
jgi:hypothetical protein